MMSTDAIQKEHAWMFFLTWTDAFAGHAQGMQDRGGNCVRDYPLDVLSRVVPAGGRPAPCPSE